MFYSLYFEFFNPEEQVSSFPFSAPCSHAFHLFIYLYLQKKLLFFILAQSTVLLALTLRPQHWALKATKYEFQEVLLNKHFPPETFVTWRLTDCSSGRSTYTVCCQSAQCLTSKFYCLKITQHRYSSIVYRLIDTFLSSIQQNKMFTIET